MILYVKLEYLQKYSRSVYWNVITQMRLDDKFTTVECAGPMFVPPPIYSLTSHTLLLKPSQPHKSPESCAINLYIHTHNKQISRFIYSLALLKCSSCLLQGLIIGIVRAHFQTSRPHTHTHNTRHVRMCVCHFSFLSLPTSQSTGNFRSTNTVACSACMAIILYRSIYCIVDCAGRRPSRRILCTF
jgi:hypothetical protein